MTDTPRYYRYSPVGCAEGSLYVYNSEGVLLLPALNIGSAIAKSAVSDNFIAVISDIPSLFVWNLKEKKNVLVGTDFLTFAPSQSCYHIIRSFAKLLSHYLLLRKVIITC